MAAMKTLSPTRMRSTSATEMVTVPAMTTPRSSTVFNRSLRTSCSVSSTRASLSIRRLPDEMIRRPWPRELEPEPARLVLLHERGELAPKCLGRIPRQQEGCIEDRRPGHAFERPPRQRVEHGSRRVPLEGIEGALRDIVADAPQLLGPLGLELSRQQISLPG